MENVILTRHLRRRWGPELLLELDDDQRFWRETVQEAVSKQCPRPLFGRSPKAPPTLASFGSGTSKKAGRTSVGNENFIELALVLEELGRASDPTPYLASMTQFAPLVGDRFDPTRVGAAVYAGVTAHRDRDGWVLDGTAHSSLTGTARTGLQWSLPPEYSSSTPVSVTARRADVFDPVLHVADLQFADVRVPEEDRVAADAERAWHIALTGMAITTVGACQRIVDLTLEHLKQRYQFGVPIGSFQALQHKAADMHVAIERARALSYFSALTIAADDPRRRLSAVDGQSRSGRGPVAGRPARHAVLWRDGIHLGERSAVRHQTRKSRGTDVGRRCRASRTYRKGVPCS